MAKTIITILLLAAILAACAPTGEVTAGPELPPEPATPADHMEDLPAEPSAPPQADLGEPDATFRLTGENFRFRMDGEENPTLRVQQGDVVRIEFESTQGFHDWVVDGFGATEKVRPENGLTSVEFVADRAGTFEYYCSVGSHRANGMKGMLVVE